MPNEKTTPNKTAVCPQAPFVFLLEKSSKIASTYLFFKFLGNEIAFVSICNFIRNAHTNTTHT